MGSFCPLTNPLIAAFFSLVVDETESVWIGSQDKTTSVWIGSQFSASLTFRTAQVASFLSLGFLPLFEKDGR